MQNALRFLLLWIAVCLQVVGVEPVGLRAQGSPAAFDILEPIVTSYRSTNSGAQLVRSGDSDVIIGWRSSRRGVPYNQIYIQKIDQGGHLLWEQDGSPLCAVSSNQTSFSMVEDGYGGVIVAWEDYREGPDAPLVYVQRINMRGEQLWGLEGLRVCTGSRGQRKPQLISDLEGGFYLVWEDHRQGMDEPDIYAQLLDLSGRIRWRPQGIPIATATGAQQNFALATDEKNFLYLVWEDFRNGLYWNLYAQKLDQTGNFFWKAGGLDLFAGVEESHHKPAIVPDGYGGLLFVYQKYSSDTHGTDIYRCRINSAGEVVFHFATCYSSGEQLNPKIVKKGSKALLCWEDKRSGNWDIYAQMIRLHDGILEWDINGIPVAATSMDEQQPVVIAASSYGYQVFSWTRKSFEGEQICTQKLNNLGEPNWQSGGVVVNPNSKDQHEAAILPDEAGGLWCLWTEKQSGGVHVFAQHLNANCLPLLHPGGVRIGVEHDAIFAKVSEIKVLATRSGEYFLAWQDYRNGMRNADIYLQKMGVNGKPLWRKSGMPVCQAPGEQSYPILVEDGVGGVIVGWYDKRGLKDDDIFAQRVDGAGKVLWQGDGVPICAAKGDQNSLKVITDGSEGAIFCWVDARNLAVTGFDLYLQRVGHDGERLWGVDGKPFSNFQGLQTSPNIVSDHQGGAFLVWQDGRNDLANIYLQRINSFGIYEWDFGGRPTFPSATHQRYPVLSVNYQNELNIVWQESRQGEGFDKLYMQSHTSNGGKMWNTTGIPVCQMQGRQSSPQIVRSVAGDFWVLWLDERSRGSLGVLLMAQRFDMSGRTMLASEGLRLGEAMDEWNHFSGIGLSNGALVATWTQNIPGDKKKVYLQHLDSAGNKRFGYSGCNLGELTAHQTEPHVAYFPDSHHALLVFVEKSANQGAYSIKGAIVKP